jgi:hypothetical protein
MLSDKDKERIEQQAERLIYPLGKEGSIKMQEYGFNAYKTGAESEASYQQERAKKLVEAFTKATNRLDELIINDWRLDETVIELQKAINEYNNQNQKS